MRIWLRALGRIALTVLAGGLLSATLARFAPGFGSDEEQLDVRRSAASRERLQQTAAADNDLLEFSRRTFAGYLHGDLGYSQSLNRPINALIHERLGSTSLCILIGLGGAWAAGFGAILLSLVRGNGLTRPLLTAGASSLQCLPAAVLALLMIACGGRGFWVGGATLALALAPRVFFYAGNILTQTLESSHVLAARARGLSKTRVLLRHAVPSSLPQLVSFAGISISLACSAAIPVEVILDIPGVGQLAWQAALARDLSLLLAITILLSLIVVLSNAAAESLAEWNSPAAEKV